MGERLVGWLNFILANVYSRGGGFGRTLFVSRVSGSRVYAGK